MADVPANSDSGAAGTEYQTIEALRRLGHEVDAVWGDKLPQRIKHGNSHYLFELPLGYRKLMLEKLRSKNYDVIHVNQPHGYRAAKALRELGLKSVFIHRSHGLEMRVESDLKPWRAKYDSDGRRWVRKSLSKAMAYALSFNSRGITRYADGHIVSARQCRDFLNTIMGVPKERIAVIPQAPPDHFFRRPPAEMSPRRLERVLYVGQFTFFKAPMITAQVMNRLSEARPEISFTWVCSRAHHAEVAALLTAGARARLTLMDWMSQDELMRAYDRHGIFLFPSFFEGFGKTFLEAMARGLCVVAADNGGAHDVVSHEVDGMLAPTGCVDTMVDHCLRLFSDRSFALRISNAASETARAYTWERVATETTAFYKDRLEAKLCNGHNE